MIFNMTGGGGTGKSEILVYAPTGSVVTVQRGSETPKTAVEKDGVWTFKNCDLGTWTVNASLDGQTATDTVVIQEDGQLMRYEVTVSYVHIYGIQRDITNPSPLWTRTDEAVGITEPTASVGAVAGQSAFDNFYPWSGIQRETLSTGDVMVKIPKFYYRRYRDGNVEHIQIADGPAADFELHPAFNHAGVERDSIYVGAYKTSANNKSISGATPQGSQNRATMRLNARNKGTGWGIINISTLSAIQMLILVEFATNNVQTAIGRGWCDKTSGSSVSITGGADSVPNLTGRPAGTDGMTDVVWRGIEGFWGNVWEWVDGVNWNGGTYYVCNDPSKYADNTDANYSALSYTGDTSWSKSFITVVGLDPGSLAYIMLPDTAGSGSNTTYQSDGCTSSTGWRLYGHGGRVDDGSICGLFAARLSSDSSDLDSRLGSRLFYIPQEVTA